MSPSNQERDNPIGIFDSGVGGLTVAKEIKKVLPDMPIIYFGDTARLPYGNKSARTIQKYSCEITEFLGEKGYNIKVFLFLSYYHIVYGLAAAAKTNILIS